MTFLIEDILKYSSLSIAGLEKNTGKTECLNFILHGIKDKEVKVALTSIGVDGEDRDRLYGISKPEIEVYTGMWFVTTEKHYREKRLTSEIVEIGEEQTALGRLVRAKAVNTGKVLLSGPPDAEGMKKLIADLLETEVGLVIVDGALSRLSLASPTVTEAMILATGAAVSENIPQLVRKTKYVYDLICLEKAEKGECEKLIPLTSGIWALDSRGNPIDLHIPSCFLFDAVAVDLFRYGRRFYIGGAVSDKFLNFLRVQQEPVEIIIRDFTRMFAGPEIFYAFLQKGHRVKVLFRTQLLAVCVNPQSPGGMVLNTEKIEAALQKEIRVPVINVRNWKEDAV